MVFGFPRPPTRFPLSTQTMSGSNYAARGSWQPPGLPPCGAPTSLGRRTCLVPETEELRQGWAHIQHSVVIWQVLVLEQMKKSEDTQFPKFLF